MHWRLGLILLSALTTTVLLASRFLGGPVQAGPLGAPMGTAFTYQGQIRLSSVPVNGTCDFQFSLYDAPSGGGLVAGPVAANGVPVANGLFTTMLDFGAGAFNGDARWLEIAASCPGGGGGFTTLAQRQALTPTRTPCSPRPRPAPRRCWAR